MSAFRRYMTVASAVALSIGCAATSAQGPSRSVELQTKYRQVPATGPISYICDGNPANEVVVTFFETEPPVLIAERGDSVSLMSVQPSASGAKYQGRNETFWEHQGEASITWGYEAEEMRCTKKPK